jgi:hypothetical protein
MADGVIALEKLGIFRSNGLPSFILNGPGVEELFEFHVASGLVSMSRCPFLGLSASGARSPLAMTKSLSTCDFFVV